MSAPVAIVVGHSGRELTGASRPDESWAAAARIAAELPGHVLDVRRVLA